MNKFKSRGQISGYDVLVSFIIFILMFLVLRGITLDSIKTADHKLGYNEMQIIANQAFEGLTTTQGYPTNWSETDVNLIGLMQRQGVLDTDKVTSLQNISYDLAREKLGLGKYDFLLQIENPNTTISFGEGPTGEIVVEKKSMLYDGEISYVTLKVFR